MEYYKTLMKEIKDDTDEKIYYVLGLKNNYCPNNYITQGNLQIKCNPYQTTNDISHKTRTKNLKICMETQKIPNHQNNLEKEKQSWRDQAL